MEKRGIVTEKRRIESRRNGIAERGRELVRLAMEMNSAYAQRIGTAMSWPEPLWKCVEVEWVALKW